MKNRSTQVGALAIMLIIAAGCDSSLTDLGGEVTLSGQVLNRDTNQPVSDATIRLEGWNDSMELSNPQGSYTFTLHVDSTVYVNVIAFKEGFRPDTIQVLTSPERSIQVPTFRLVPSGADIDVGPSEGAARIILADKSAQSIGVKEGGSDEIATIAFVVQDSTGRPIDISGAVDVNFGFGAAPGGGEELYPKTATTNNNGVVNVSIMSGTVAGVVQVIASTEIDGRTFRSEPVSITIHGGMPHLDHFAVVSEQLNIHGGVVFGLENRVTAFVGDRYGNPVRQGTPVYFTTDGGIIAGSAETDVLGRATVTLLSANPQPSDGFVTVTASTANDANVTIETTCTVLFSTHTQLITVSPSSISGTLPEVLTFHVHDSNGNPLAPGTQITVIANGQNVMSSGDMDVTLGDTQQSGRSRTEFVVQIVGGDGDEEPSLDSVSIEVRSPNGDISALVDSQGVMNVDRIPESIDELLELRR